MSKNLYNTVLYFYKKAVDVPDWAHSEFVSELEKLKKVEKIEKDPRLVNFREPAPRSVVFTQKPWEREMLLDIMEQFNTVMYSFRIFKDFMKEYPEFEKFQKDFTNVYILCQTFSDGDRLEILRTNVMPVGKQNLRFVKAYNTVYEKYNAFIDAIAEKMLSDEKYRRLGISTDDKIKKFDDLRGKREWSARTSTDVETKHEIVFTTKHMDILGMSSRGDWTSCQTIDERAQYLGYARGVLGSCLSKYVGVIYLTDGSNYKERGERMIRRCAVWLVRNDEGNDVLYLQTMYPQDYSLLRDIFENLLTKHTGLPTTSDSYGLKKYMENYPEGIRAPYDDASLREHASYDVILQQVRSGNFENIHALSTEEQKQMFDSLYKETGKVAPYVQLINPYWKNAIELFNKAMQEDPMSIMYISAQNNERYQNFFISLAKQFSNDKIVFEKILRRLDPYNKECLQIMLDALLNGQNIAHVIPAEHLSWELLSKAINNNKDDYDFVLQALHAARNLKEDINKIDEYKNLVYEYADKNRYVIDLARPQWGDIYRKIVIKAVKKYQENFDAINPNWEGLDDIAEILAKYHPKFLKLLGKDIDKLSSAVEVLIDNGFSLTTIFHQYLVELLGPDGLMEFIKALMDKDVVSKSVLFKYLPYTPSAPSFNYMKKLFLDFVRKTSYPSLYFKDWKFDDDFITIMAKKVLSREIAQYEIGGFSPQIDEKIKQLSNEYEDNITAKRLLENADTNPESFFLHFKQDWDTYNKAAIKILNLCRKNPKLLLVLDRSWYSSQYLIRHLTDYAATGQISCYDVPLPLRISIAKGLNSFDFDKYPEWERFKKQ